MADHVREHHSLLAAAEKRLLIRMAQRLPSSIHPDHLTALALGAMVLAGAGYALAPWNVHALWLVVTGLAINWFGDSLDGTLARVRHTERPRYGFYVDHVVDMVGTTALIGGLACSGFMTPLVALSLLVAYLLLSGELYLATAVRRIFAMSFAGVGPTELRIFLAIGTMALFGDPHVDLGGLGRLRLFDVGGAIAIVGMAITMTVAVWRNASALSQLEPVGSSSPPVRSAGSAAIDSRPRTAESLLHRTRRTGGAPSRPPCE